MDFFWFVVGRYVNLRRPQFHEWFLCVKRLKKILFQSKKFRRSKVQVKVTIELVVWGCGRKSQSILATPINRTTKHILLG